MKKSGFTMMELVFVIVVIGILAGLAVPKLMATRDDAEYSKAMQNIDILVRDLSNFYASQGMAGIPLLNDHAGSQKIYYADGSVGTETWKPANIAAMTNVPLDGPMERGKFSFKVAGKECFTVQLDVMDFREMAGDEVANQVDRDVLLLLFHKNKTNKTGSCIKVQNSNRFNNFNDDPNDGGKERYFNQKISVSNGRGGTTSWEFKVTGGLIAGQDRGLFDDEAERWSDEEIENKKNATGTFTEGITDAF